MPLSRLTHTNKVARSDRSVLSLKLSEGIGGIASEKSELRNPGNSGYRITLCVFRFLKPPARG